MNILNNSIAYGLSKAMERKAALLKIRMEKGLKWFPAFLRNKPGLAVICIFGEPPRSIIDEPHWDLIRAVNRAIERMNRRKRRDSDADVSLQFWRQ